MKSKKWTQPEKAYINQGRAGACSAFGMLNYLSLSPGPTVKPTNSMAKRLFQVLKENDSLFGESYDYGILEDNLKFLRTAGVLAEYRWLNTFDNCLEALEKSPVLFQLPWCEGFHYPKLFCDKGRVVRGGADTGYHLLPACELDVKRERVWFLQSYGRWHGVKGRIWMDFSTLRFIYRKGFALTLDKHPDMVSNLNLILK